MIKLKTLFILGASFLLMASCSDDDDNNGNGDGNGNGNPPVEEGYVAPTYADDYSAMSAWIDRASWNLANVHDPTVEKCGDYYYMYGTDASYGNSHDGHGHFPARRSKDLVNWEFRGMAMAKIPDWVKDTLNNIRGRYGLEPIENPNYGCWAPVVRKVGNKYRMYYSIIIDNFITTGLPNTEKNFEESHSWTERAFIGLMETDDLTNNLWVDKGMVIQSVSDKGTDWSRASLTNWQAYFKYNAIDPTFIIAPDNKQWLIYGSWHSGIVAVEVDPATGKPYQLNEIGDYGTPVARRIADTGNYWYRWQGQEAPEIIYNEETGYYYLFLAYDELAVAYNTRVCRSTNIEGPYYGIDGADISTGANCFPVLTHPYKFNNHSGWVGISHCCVFQDPDTKEWFYSSQGRLPAGTSGNDHSNAIMMGHVRKIKWTSTGWPVVMPERYTNMPQDEITENDLIGTWEHINLVYQAGVQQVATSVTLNADKSASGTISGTWSYDAVKKILKVGSLELHVERELDWEADPRVPTITYAGLSGDGKSSLWGKKVN